MEYELIISRASPYSSKVLALMGYSGIKHRVRVQNGLTRYTLVRRLTGATMVPVLRRGDWALNDSTAIARYVMERSPEPTLPEGPGGTLAWLLEDFADEWITRWIVHSRWSHPEDAAAVSEVIGRELTGLIPIGAGAVGKPVSKLLQARLKKWGIQEENDIAMRRSGGRSLVALEGILSRGPSYLFGAYPTIADFAFYGALGQYRRDPTGRKVLNGYPSVEAYIERLDAMTFRPPTMAVDRGEKRRPLEELHPLFAEAMGAYWPVLIANYRALKEGARRGETRGELLDGSFFTFEPSKYQARCLERWLRLVDEAYEKGDRVFGEEGIRMERALIGRIGELCDFERGRALLRGYKNLGLN